MIQETNAIPPPTGCPPRSVFEDVLDGLADESQERATRRHLSQCARCLDQFGAEFELELWLPAALEVSVVGQNERCVSAAPRRKARSGWGVALAAALLLILARWSWFDGGQPAPEHTVQQPSTPESPVPLALQKPAPAPLRIAFLRVETSIVGPEETRRWSLLHQASTPGQVSLTQELLRGDELRLRNQRVTALDDLH